MKIISLAPCITEILFAIGAGEEIVARSEYCDYPKEARKIKKIKNWTDPDIRIIKKLKPDLVFTVKGQEDLTEKLKKENIAAAYIKAERLADVISAIERIGKLTGKSEQARKLTAEMLLAFAEIRQESEAVTARPRLYIEEWQDPPFAAGYWAAEIAGIAGARYGPVKPGEPGREISLSQIKRFNPQLIILSVCGAKADRNAVLKRKGWKSIAAVKNRQIHVFDDSLLNRPGPRLVTACRRIQELVLEKNKKGKNQ